VFDVTNFTKETMLKSNSPASDVETTDVAYTSETTALCSSRQEDEDRNTLEGSMEANDAQTKRTRERDFGSLSVSLI